MMTEEQVRLEEIALKRKEKGVDATLWNTKEDNTERIAAEKRETRKNQKEGVLKAETRDWEEKERVKQTKELEKVVTLDVGGTKYRTTVATLTKYPDSMLGVMFSGRHNLPQQEDGSYFIDRDGDVFKYILMYLRDRDHCSDVLYDEDLHNPNNRVPPPSLKKRQMLHVHHFCPSLRDSQMLRRIAFEAKYFQVRELESMALISLNAGRCDLHRIPSNCRVPNEEQLSTPVRSFLAIRQWLNGQYYPLDYGQHMAECPHQSANELKCTNQCISMNCKYSEAQKCSKAMSGTIFTKKITFDSCDLSGVTFSNCYFQEGVSFDGCILHGTKFERVGGLVRHKVHFAPWQVDQAQFEPELLQALKDNGCIY